MNQRFPIPYWISIIAAVIVLAGALSAFSNDRPIRGFIFLVFGLGSIVVVNVAGRRPES